MRAATNNVVISVTVTVYFILTCRLKFHDSALHIIIITKLIYQILYYLLHRAWEVIVAAKINARNITRALYDN